MRTKLIPVILLALGLSLLATAGERAPRVSVFAPSHLSALEDTEVLVAVSGAPATAGELVATVASRDGLVRIEAYRAPLSPESDLQATRVRIPASALAAFPLGEELDLAVRLVTTAGDVAGDAVSVSLLAALSRGESAGWTVVLADKPAQVYTTRATLLTYLLYNPKNNPKNANLVLKFKGDEGKVKSKHKVGVSLPAGLSEATILVPSSVTSEARLKEATLLQTALMRDGSAKAKDQALVDFDLNTTAAADPAYGVAPMRVSFTASTTGGRPPYVYNWWFGDGSAASEQNPFHNYTVPGLFTATLTVTDALGGRVSDTVEVTVLP